MDLSICFCYYNEIEITKRCLDSIRNSVINFDYEIILTDNASTDNSSNIIEREYADLPIKIIRKDYNSGCSGGWNTSIKAAQSNLILLCNNDVIYEKDCIQRMMKFMRNEPNIFIASPVELFSKSNIHQHSDAKLARYFEKYKKLTSGCVTKGVWNIVSAFMRKSVFETVGYFDENFTKAFYEDFDYGHRINEKGIYGVVVGGSVFYHIGSATVVKSSNSTGNKKYYEKKWRDGYVPGKPIETLNNKYKPFSIELLRGTIINMEDNK